MPIKLDQALGVHAQALSLRSRRSQVLANNIANADTPGFKARDIDFRAALGQAGEQAMSMAATRRGHIQPDAGHASADLMYRMPMQPSLDGNTVDAQAEKAAFAENAVRYQATLTFLQSRIAGLRAAIKGGE